MITVSALIAALTVPSQAWAGVAQADGEVKVKGGDFIGDGVINDTGVGQTAKAKVKQGETAKFTFRYHNYGSSQDNFFIGGCPFGHDEFKIKYFTGGENVTGAVNAGTLEFPNVGNFGGVTPRLKAEVKVRKSTPDGFVEDNCVPAVPEFDANDDSPEWRVKVK